MNTIESSKAKASKINAARVVTVVPYRTAAVIFPTRLSPSASGNATKIATAHQLVAPPAAREPNWHGAQALRAKSHRLREAVSAPKSERPD